MFDLGIPLLEPKSQSLFTAGIPRPMMFSPLILWAIMLQHFPPPPSISPIQLSCPTLPIPKPESVTRCGVFPSSQVKFPTSLSLPQFGILNHHRTGWEFMDTTFRQKLMQMLRSTPAHTPAIVHLAWEVCAVTQNAHIISECIACQLFQSSEPETP